MTRMLTTGAVLLAVLATTATAIGTSKDQAAVPSKNALRLRLAAEPPSLNPLTTDGERSQEIRTYVVESLLTRDPQTFEWRSQLASHWSTEGAVFDFEIRPDAVWSDGTPVTADDVKFSFDFLFDERYPTAHMRPYYSGISRVEVLGPRNVRFVASETRFTNFEAAASLAIVPRHIYGDPTVAVGFQDVMVGSGPYMLEHWQRGREITLKKNPRWWGWNAGQDLCARRPERIAFQFVNDPALAFALLKTGGLDYLALSSENYTRAARMESSTKAFKTERVENHATKMHYGIGFNLRREIFKDARVRAAMNHVVDRETIARRFFQGTVRPAAGPWNSQSLGADPSIAPSSFDLQAASKLLHDAGWSDLDGDMILDRRENGRIVPFSVTILTWTRQMERVLTLVQNDARKIGVNIEIRMVPEATYGRLLDDGNFDMADMSGPMPLVDFDPTVLWHTKGISREGLNFAAYSNPEVDRRIDALAGNFNADERRSLLREIYAAITHDQPELFLFEESDVMYAYSQRVQRVARSLNYDVGVACWTLDPDL